MGLGPRRVLRWCAGACASKDPLKKQEQQDFAEVHDALFNHFTQRFDIEGIVQVYFAWCEVSKAVDDLYTGKGIVYEAHVGRDVSETLLSESATYGFDDVVNAPSLLRLKFPTILIKELHKFPAQGALRVPQKTTAKVFA